MKNSGDPPKRNAESEYVPETGDAFPMHLFQQYYCETISECVGKMARYYRYLLDFFEAVEKTLLTFDTQLLTLFYNMQNFPL